MKKNAFIASLLLLIMLSTMVFSACNTQTLVSFDVDNTDDEIIQSIKSEEKNTVKTVVEVPLFT